MNAIDRLIAVAEGELGYLEKKSNRDLDDKTANAGSSNYTKYNRDMKRWAGSAGLSDQWCQNFVDWCFVTAFGVDVAKKLLGKFTNYTPTGSDQFKKRGAYIKRGKGKPKRGDVIYFYSKAKGRIGHVGIVTKVTDSTVYTIEGNTDGSSALVTNGGMVKRKSYSLKSTYVDGYGSVDYSIVGDDTSSAPAGAPSPQGEGMGDPVLGERVLFNYMEGPDVKELQTALISLGFGCGVYGADGEFGDCTEMAVRAFQAAKGVPMTGQYDAATHRALTEALLGVKPEAQDGKARYVEIQKNKKCYIRDAPNTEGKILGVAYGGERYEYRGETFQNGWHRIAHKGVEAFISGKYGKLVE